MRILKPAFGVFALLGLVASTALAQDGVTRYVRFTTGATTSHGILEGGNIRVLSGDPIFDDGVQPTGRTVRVSDITLELPIDPGRVHKVFGVAGNYNAPQGQPRPVEHPSWFAKYTTSLQRSGDPVEVPFGATNFNFEGELVLIIGAGGRYIPESAAMSHLWGVAVGNDYSENDWCGQRRGIEEPSRVFCKAGDGFAVLGDQIVRGLDISDLGIEVRLNGEVVARGRTPNMRNNPAALISKLSHYITLTRGDIVYTGTVAPPQFAGRRQLWRDDVIEVEIEGIGMLRNELVRYSGEPKSGPPLPEPQGITRYVRYTRSGTTSFGILEGDTISQLNGDPIPGPAQRTGRTVSVSDVELGLPVDPMQPGRKVLGVASNYNNPARPPRQVPHPRWFFKLPTSLSPHGEDVQLPPEAGNFNFEAEMVLIIGRMGRNIPQSEALDYIFGVAVGNDWSENTWFAQRDRAANPNALIAKAVDTWASMGPQIVRGLEFGDLQLEVRMNGELAGRGRTSNMTNRPARLVSYLSRYMTLLPGDLIYTGTVSPASFPDVRRQMREGDVIEVELDHAGVVRNRIVSMRPYSARR